jgi:hypothetical protein
MNLVFCTLEGLISRRMTIHAARMRQDFSKFSEDRPRALAAILDLLERLGFFQRILRMHGDAGRK